MLESKIGFNSQAASQDIVFLAVHPPHVAVVLADIRASLKPDAILISLAPKWTIEKLAGCLIGFTRIARMIPNAPSDYVATPYLVDLTRAPSEAVGRPARKPSPIPPQSIPRPKAGKS